MFKNYAFKTALLLLLVIPFAPPIPLESISDMPYIASSRQGSSSQRSVRSSSRRSQHRTSHRTSSHRVQHGQGGASIRKGSSQGGTRYIYRYHEQPQMETPTYIYRYHEQPIEEEEPTYVYQSEFEPEEETQEEPQVYAEMAPETPAEEPQVYAQIAPETPSETTTTEETSSTENPRVASETDTKLIIENPATMTEKQKTKLSKGLKLDIRRIPPNISRSLSEYCRKKYWDKDEKDPLIRQINYYLIISCFGEMGNKYLEMRQQQAPSTQPEAPPQAPSGPETPTD